MMCQPNEPTSQNAAIPLRRVKCLKRWMPLWLMMVLASATQGSAQVYVFEKKWGSYGNATGQFINPIGVAADTAGDIYVVDQAHRIQKFTAAGAFIATWGSVGSGNNQFVFPKCLAIDAAGNVYIADQGNDRVVKCTASGSFITAWGTAGDGDGEFYSPYGVAVDNAGNVYVTEPGNRRVQKFTSTGAYLTKWGSEGSGDGQFMFPYGIAVDSANNVYVADYGLHRIQKFSSTGAFITKWANAGAGDGQFNGPFGVTIDSSDHVFVVDRGNARVQKFTTDGVFITKFGVYGSGDGEFNNPYEVGLDASGNIYVSDTFGHRVQKFKAIHPPSSPAITSPNSGIDYETNDNSAITISGSCDAGTDAIQVNGGTSGVIYTPGATTWSYLSGTLSTGPNPFSVTAENVAGTSDATNITITFDVTAPSPPLVNGITPTNDATPTWSWTPGGGGDGTYRYDLDTSGSWTQTTDAEFTPATPLSEGTYRLTVQERDGAGNWSADGFFDISIDNAPPSVESIVVLNTKGLMQDFLVTFSEPVGGVDVSDFALVTTGSVTDGEVVAVAGTAYTETYTVTVDTGTGSGTIRLDVIDNGTIVDEAGNELGGPGNGNGDFTAGEIYSNSSESLPAAGVQAWALLVLLILTLYAAIAAPKHEARGAKRSR